MTRKTIATFATLAFTLIGAQAVAGNPTEPIISAAPTPIAPIPVQMTQDWSGFYAGGSLGYATVDDEAATFGPDFDGATYGVHAGYDYDFGTFIVGGELELSGFDVADSATATEVDSVTRLKVRAGYDAGLFMPYLAAGVAQLNSSGAPLGDVDDTGSFYGFGLDYRMTDTIRVGGEVLEHDFDDYAGSGINADALTASVRVSYDF